MPRNVFPDKMMVRMAAKEVSDDNEEGEEPRTEDDGEDADSKVRGIETTSIDIPWGTKVVPPPRKSSTRPPIPPNQLTVLLMRSSLRIKVLMRTTS